MTLDILGNLASKVSATLPVVKGKNGMVTTKDSSYEGKFIDVNTIYVMLDRGEDGYIMLPWPQVTSVFVDKEETGVSSAG